MRIVLHSHFFRPSVGGCETAAELLADGLSRLGHEVRVLTETPASTTAEPPVPYQTIRVGRGTHTAPHLQWAEVLLENGPGVRYLGLCQHLQLPFVLIVQGPQAVCPVAIGWRERARCSVGLPKCLGCNVLGQRSWQNLWHLGRYALLRYYIQKAAACVFISHFLLERSLEVLRIPRATVIANPYDDTLFSAFPFNASLNDGQRPIAFVGRLVEIKGVDTFLEGYASAVKAGLQRRLHIVGDGPLRSPLLARADRLGIAHLVEWQGFLYGEELVRQYQEAVAVVVPSQWEEPFGLVAAEAMGCGTRVLVSNRGALPEVVARPEWCVQPTPQGWADALFSLREPSFSERQTLSAETQRRFGQMSQAKVYADLLTKVVPS